jgi:ferredoxin
MKAMIRQIIKIDEEKCNGCGLCVSACHEGAIALVDGKAKLIRDDYCDGLGNCLPVCPTGAISFEMREAAPYNEEEVKKSMERKRKEQEQAQKPLPCGCPGLRSKAIMRQKQQAQQAAAQPAEQPSMLNQWPVQIKLVPFNAPYFKGAKLLIAADCTAYAYAGFHSRFMRDKITIIGCPKLDEVDYTEKLTQILKHNDIKSVTIVRMEVPCCGGIVRAAIAALQNSGKMIPWQVYTISTDGVIIEE